MTVPKETKWSDDDTKLATGFVKLKGIVLHGNIQLDKKGIATAFAKNVHDVRQRINLLLDTLVEGSKIRNPTNVSILFGNNKGGSCPF